MAETKLRLLIVEDHPATLRGLKMFMGLSGYAVETAGDVKTALQVAESSPFDILLCDLNLPDGTGWQLMERLSKRSGPVCGIAYSAFDEPEHIARSKAAGFAEHVVKGTTPETLVAAIQRVSQARAESLGARTADNLPQSNTPRARAKRVTAAA